MKRSKFQKLSDKGQARKQAMLLDLQNQLHEISNRRHGRAKFTAAMTLLIVAGTVLFSAIPNRQNTSIQPGKHNVASPPKFSFASVESNQRDVADRYVVSNKKNSSFSFETMSDDELVKLLKSTGDNFVLGEIDGRKMLLPARMMP